MADDMDFGDAALNEIWNTFADQLEGAELEDFTDNVSDYFESGWIYRDIDSDERQAARDEFEDWLERHLLDIADFDWEAWRDWYDSV